MHAFSCTNSTSSTEPGDIFQARLAGSAPRAALFPGRVCRSLRHGIPFAYVFSLPCWGRPSGCIIPTPLGPDPVACIFLHLPKSICSSCLTCLRQSPAQSLPPTGPPHRHGADAWVRPGHVDKSERSSSVSRHAPRTSPHQALSAFTSSQSNQRQAGSYNGKPCFFLCLLTGIPRGG